MQYKRIAIDTSKHVFTLHGIDESDRAVLRRDLRRAEVERFFSRLPPTDVALEACGASHHWGRLLAGQGHRVRLIPAQYVKPFVKRGKNDRADAAAICEAAGRPGMSTVPVKSAANQAALMVLRTRDLLVRQRTQLVNALRGHAAEFGLVSGRGIGRVEALLAAVGEAELPAPAPAVFAQLKDQLSALEGSIAALDKALLAQHAASEVSQRLAEVPGIGPITAISLTLSVDAARFENGRHLSAWLGLTPKECSTGGKPRLGGISRAGNERLRSLLVVGATSVIRHAKPGSRLATDWLLGLLARRPRKLVAVALANKMARVVWAHAGSVTGGRLCLWRGDACVTVPRMRQG